MERAGNREESAQHTKGKQFMLFLMCAGVAAMLWLFTTLSGLFEYSVKVRLAYNLPEDQTTTRQLPNEATMLVQTTGWQLIREEFNDRSLSLNISNIDANDELITNQHIELFIEDMPSDIHVLHVYPDTISLHMEPRVSKKLPIELFATLSSPGVILDSLLLIPDSVMITGPESMVKTITKWDTDPVTTYIDSAISGITALAKPTRQEIALSAVACQYFVKLDIPIKVSIPGKAFCAVTNTSVPVTIYTHVPQSHLRTFAFEEFSPVCSHNQEDSTWHLFTCTKQPGHTYNTIVLATFNTPE